LARKTALRKLAAGQGNYLYKDSVEECVILSVL